MVCFVDKVILTTLQDGKDYNPWVGYARSKAANALFAMALAKRLKSTDVLSLVSTPGSEASHLSPRASGLNA